MPDLESTLDSARIEASYQFSERLAGTLDLRYERFELQDWALVSETTLPTILTMGAEPYDYDVYAVGIGFRYRFGDDDQMALESHVPDDDGKMFRRVSVEATRVE